MNRLTCIVCQILAFSLLSLIFLSPVIVKAEENVVVCAAVLPCLPNGSVMPPYDSGSCAQHYAAQCRDEHLNKMGEKLVSCEASSAQLGERISRLKRALRSVKRAASQQNRH